MAAPGASLSAFEGVNGFHYSHTYAVVQSSNVSSSNALYASRIKTRLMLNAMTVRNNAGYWANDFTTAALVGANAWTPNTRGLVLWDGITNDLLSEGGTTLGLTGFRNAVAAFCWLMWTGTRIEDSNVAFTYGTGTWAAEPNGSAEFSNGTAQFSDTASASFDVAVTGSDHVLFLVGRQDGETVGAVTNVLGGTAQVKVDGTTVATVPLGNQIVKSTAPATRARGPIAVPLLNIGSGSHTITVTNVGAAGTRLAVDFIAPLSTGPADVLLFHQCPWPTAQYVSLSTPAGMDAYNAAVDEVAASLIALNKPVRSVKVATGWNPATMIASGVSRHLNDLGSRVYADRACEVLVNRPFRLGINNL